MKRRDFIKYGAGGLAALVVGTKMPWIMDNPAYASNMATTGVINLRVTDALKQMATFNTGIIPVGPNTGQVVGPGMPATCYFWIYQDAGPNPLPPDCPGPIIFATSGDQITVNVTNNLTTPHAFSIPRLRGVTTGPINPGQTGSVTFRAGPAGTYLYYDDLNAPVNRVMGLHGAFIVMPRLKPAGTRAGGGHKMTPYDRPMPNVQQLFDDLGRNWWPGLAWEEGDPNTDTAAFRQNVWVLHQASPNLFEAVGNNTSITFTTTAGEVVSGLARSPGVFTKAFLSDRLNQAAPVNPATGWPSNFIAQYFTISGQSGHFSHNNPFICPFSRVGEPVLIRILNAGLWGHSTHIHANHIFVLQHNNLTDVVPGSFDNPIWVDVYTANPLDTYDWLVPYMRPPDVPNDLGIGRDELEHSLPVITTPIPFYGTNGNPTPAGVTTWPPLQELDFHIPQAMGAVALGGDPLLGRTALDLDGLTVIDLAVHMSPLCFPMHDHAEPSQVANGGNYNCGMISGINFTGDRKGAGPAQSAQVITFDMYPPEKGPDMQPGKKGALNPAPDFESPAIP